MKLKTVCEHTFDEELLPAKAKVLDLGALGMIFSDALKKDGHSVYSVDIQDIGPLAYRCAITDYDGKCGIIPSSDKQAFRISPQGKEIYCFTLQSFMGMVNVEQFDLIKMDIEGSEYEVIKSLTKAPAKQLSIEFHLHTGVYGQNGVDEMVNKLLSLGYEIVQHKLENIGNGCGMNYWDSLFVLK